MLRVLFCIAACLQFASVENQQTEPVSAECLQCICYATSGCDLAGGCADTTCGPYGITWEYWSDAAKPVLPSDNPFIDGAYARCTTNKECAERTLQNYMLRYAKDCDGNGRYSCYDFAALHRVGADSCAGRLDEDYSNKLSACFQQFQLEWLVMLRTELHEN